MYSAKKGEGHPRVSCPHVPVYLSGLSAPKHEIVEDLLKVKLSAKKTITICINTNIIRQLYTVM